MDLSIVKLVVVIIEKSLKGKGSVIISDVINDLVDHFGKSLELALVTQKCVLAAQNLVNLWFGCDNTLQYEEYEEEHEDSLLAN